MVVVGSAQAVPSVVRAHPAVSVVVDSTSWHVPPMQTGVNVDTVREPLSAQGPA